MTVAPRLALRKEPVIYTAAEMLPDSDGPVARTLRPHTRLMCCLALLAAGFAHAQDAPRTGGPFVPTPQEVVDRMLELADVKASDFVVDWARATAAW